MASVQLALDLTVIGHFSLGSGLDCVHARLWAPEGSSASFIALSPCTSSTLLDARAPQKALCTLAFATHEPFEPLVSAAELVIQKLRALQSVILFSAP